MNDSEKSTSYHDGFGCSPAQYHGVISRLWEVLGKKDEGVQDKDVFTQCEEKIKKLEEKAKRLSQWVGDLQSKMWVNCVYCGHRYGPSEHTPVSMADVLKEHVENCPKHPMSTLKQENQRLMQILKNAAKIAEEFLE